VAARSLSLQAPCTLSGINALVLGIIGLLAAAIGAAVGALFAPWPFDVGLLLVGAGLVVAANALLHSLNAAITAYRDCRDRAEGRSECSLSSVLQTATQVTFFVGPGSFLIAAAVIVIPWLGKALASPWIWGAVTNCGIAIALLLGVLINVYAYAACRNNERRPATPAVAGSPIG
jgi:hypothetical protein